jgi:hypothetical protein
LASVSLSTLRARLGHVHPARIDAEAAAEALRQAPSDKKESLRDAIALFDKMIRDRGRHGAIADLLPEAPVGRLPMLRDAALDWSRFSPAFRAELETMIQRAMRPEKQGRDRHGGRLGGDPLEGRRKPKRMKKVRNKDAARKAIRGSLPWLVRHVWPDRTEAYALASPRYLLDETVIARGVEAYVARARADAALKNADETASASSYVARLKTFAARNDAPQDVLWAIQDAMEDDGVDAWQTREMSASRENFVKLLARDPAVARCIVTGPRELLASVRRDQEAWDRIGTRGRERVVQLTACAAAMSLQLARPLRTMNVHELPINGDGAELLAPTGDMPAWLDIERSRTKNRKAIEGPLPAVRWRQIAIWLDDVRAGADVPQSGGARAARQPGGPAGRRAPCPARTGGHARAGRDVGGRSAAGQDGAAQGHGAALAGLLRAARRTRARRPAALDDG